MKLSRTEQSIVNKIALFIGLLLFIVIYWFRLVFRVLYKSKRAIYKLAIIILITHAFFSALNTVAYSGPVYALSLSPMSYKISGASADMTSVQDQYIYTAAVKYANPSIGKTVSFLRYQLACLAFKENGYHSNNYCGDSGLACGEYQFHETTYVAFRKIMISQGLTDHIGSRLNDQDATETTAWAITHGHESDWGPLDRGDCY